MTPCASRPRRTLRLQSGWSHASPLDLALIASAATKTTASTQFVNDKLYARQARWHRASARLFKGGRSDEDIRASYEAAYNRVSNGHALFANASEDLRTVQAAASGSGGAPVLTPALASVFRMPADVTPDEWSRIWEASRDACRRDPIR